jgi:hypothetical protein
MRRTTVVLTLLVQGAVLHVSSLAAQVDQRVIAHKLLRDDWRERGYALDRAMRIPPEQTGVEVRTALRTLLEREADIRIGRYEAARRGETLKDLEDPEFILHVSRAVARLRDPRAMPVMAKALGTGSMAITEALADFGEEAVPHIVAEVESPNRWHHAVDEGLIALRFIVETRGRHQLSAATLGSIKRVAEQRLTVSGPDDRVGATLRWAIDLAVALDDPALRRSVEKLASDKRELIARGITDKSLIEMTQKQAKDRLAGVPALPRPRSFSG